MKVNLDKLREIATQRSKEAKKKSESRKEKKTMEEIKTGDLVRVKETGETGYVSYIKDYGTHVCYFIDLGKLLKFPARREWIKLAE